MMSSAPGDAPIRPAIPASAASSSTGHCGVEMMMMQILLLPEEVVVEERVGEEMTARCACRDVVSIINRNLAALLPVIIAFVPKVALFSIDRD